MSDSSQSFDIQEINQKISNSSFLSISPNHAKNEKNDRNLDLVDNKPKNSNNFEEKKSNDNLKDLLNRKMNDSNEISSILPNVLKNNIMNKKNPEENRIKNDLEVNKEIIEHDVYSSNSVKSSLKNSKINDEDFSNNSIQEFMRKESLESNTSDSDKRSDSTKPKLILSNSHEIPGKVPEKTPSLNSQVFNTNEIKEKLPLVDLTSQHSSNEIS